MSCGMCRTVEGAIGRKDSHSQYNEPCARGSLGPDVRFVYESSAIRSFLSPPLTTKALGWQVTTWFLLVALVMAAIAIRAVTSCVAGANVKLVRDGVHQRSTCGLSRKSSGIRAESRPRDLRTQSTVLFVRYRTASAFDSERKERARRHKTIRIEIAPKVSQPQSRQMTQ